MQTRRVDVAVIGAGTAGLNARREAERQGASTVLIESGPYGTMCARVGCMPSKLLIAAAEVAHTIDHATPFGIHVDGGARVDGPAVFERVRRERDRFVGFAVEDTEALSEDVRLRGSARFEAPGVLQVDDHTRVEARAIVLAVGSSPVIPETLEDVKDRVLVNDDVFELRDVPESIAVVGAGIVGLELGQCFHRLGARTAIFGRSERIGPLTDPELLASAREIFSRELDLRLGARIEARPAPDGGVRIGWEDRDGKRGEERFALVLAASGRRPNLAALDLARAEIAVGPTGVPRFDPRTGRVEGSNVFLAGDATGDFLG